MKKGHSFKLLLLFLVCASIASMAHAAGVPNTLNYQGTLTYSTGKLITATAKPVTFKLYTSALGGTPFWTEPQTVPVTNGQFSVVLGSTVPLLSDKFTGETYIGVTVEDAGLEMLPRQKMTSVPYAFNGVPKGGIIMWSGAVVPAGWALCDGSNGTPNLRDKFIMGAGSSYAIGTPGGSATHAHSGVDHLHSDDHIHSVSSMGGASGWNAVSGGSGHTAADSGHSHSVTINSKSAQGYGATTGGADRSLTSGSSSTIPPFYALAFIMKL